MYALTLKCIEILPIEESKAVMVYHGLQQNQQNQPSNRSQTGILLQVIRNTNNHQKTLLQSLNITYGSINKGTVYCVRCSWCIVATRPLSDQSIQNTCHIGPKPQNLISTDLTEDYRHVCTNAQVHINTSEWRIQSNHGVTWSPAKPTKQSQSTGILLQVNRNTNNHQKRCCSLSI